MSAPAGHGTGEVKKATINGLAVVGFGALIVGGIVLAIYASRYVPDALSRLSSAVYLSGEQPQNEPAPEEENNGFVLFPPTEEPATPEKPAEEPANEEPSPEVDMPIVETPAVTGGPQYVPAPPVYYPSTPTLYGLPDLELFEVRAGYFRNGRFIEDRDVPRGRDAGVTFTVINTGTNIASNWRVQVEVTGERDAIATGGMLRPDGYQVFTLRIEDSDEERLRIQIEVDPQDRVDESDERNNEETITLDLD